MGTLVGTPGGNSTGLGSLANSNLPDGDVNSTLIRRATSELLTNLIRTVLVFPARLTVYGSGTWTASRTSLSCDCVVETISLASETASAVVGRRLARSCQPWGSSLSSGSIDATPSISLFKVACWKTRVASA